MQRERETGSMERKAETGSRGNRETGSRGKGRQGAEGKGDGEQRDKGVRGAMFQKEGSTMEAERKDSTGNG